MRDRQRGREQNLPVSLARPLNVVRTHGHSPSISLLNQLIPSASIKLENIHYKLCTL